MKDILRAYARAVKSLTERGVLWHLIWPSLAAALVWLVLGIVFWQPMVDGVMGWIGSWDWAAQHMNTSELGAAAVLVLVKITLAVLFLPMVYVTAALVVAVVALPMMLEKVAVTRYSDLEMRKGGTVTGSAINAVVAVLLFLVGIVVSLPFWLIPGVGLVVSILLTAWMNKKAFGYDALMLHGDREEMPRLRKRYSAGLLGLGVGCALLAYVPVLNLFAPAFCGLAYVHYLLEALRRERGGPTMNGAMPA
ncbi:EI24 domain-containing protein [Nitrogeniibacter mangrovi]|uniref:EI24 domain-containing protein n=2 Tax=Nitrogeniibacter mangrovi TaxID=2016596 RepID=A0A6C1BB09_9RHOO|nr:EI24 domain-containing protein [Nitrogeniibacter mangrovi]